jgi:hypothetical protein
MGCSTARRLALLEPLDEALEPRGRVLDPSRGILGSCRGGLGALGGRFGPVRGLDLRRSADAGQKKKHDSNGLRSRRVRHRGTAIRGGPTLSTAIVTG